MLGHCADWEKFTETSTPGNQVSSYKRKQLLWVTIFWLHLQTDYLEFSLKEPPNYRNSMDQQDKTRYISGLFFQANLEYYPRFSGLKQQLLLIFLLYSLRYNIHVTNLPSSINITVGCFRICFVPLQASVANCIPSIQEQSLKIESKNLYLSYSLWTQLGKLSAVKIYTSRVISHR